MIRYFSPDSSERSRRISVAHSTYSGIESSSRPRNSDHGSGRCASSDMPADRGQQQRVELAVRRLPARRSERHASSTVAGARRRSGSGSARAPGRRSAARRRRRLRASSHCQIVRPDRGAERHQAERGHDLLAHAARAEQADEQHDARRRRAARSAARAPAKSTCGPCRRGRAQLDGAWRAGFAVALGRASPASVRLGEARRGLRWRPRPP